MVKKKSSGIEKFTPVLVIVSIVLAFAVGVLWQKVNNLESGGVKKETSAGTGMQDAQETAQAPKQQGPSLGKTPQDQAEKIAQVSSDDHIRGNPEAPITIIEYSDFNCPLSKGKRHKEN